MLTSLVRPLVPAPIRQALRQKHRDYRLQQALQRLRRRAPHLEPTEATIRDLVYGWNNPWSVQAEVIQALWRSAWESEGPILECGSGLSTLMLAVVAERRGIPFVSLEHDAAWHAHVVRVLARLRLTHARVVLAPLVSHIDHEWYELPEDMPNGIGLVVCDGPPGDTPGGRYGLLPAMAKRLAPQCVILMDDAARPGERGVLERWMHEHGTTHHIEEGGKPFAVVSLDARRTSPGSPIAHSS